MLQKLSRHIVIKNAENAGREAPGYYVFLVSHAWTEGPLMYLVYQAPPSEITWGLVRDTRKSLLDPGPLIALIENPQVCSPKFLTCEQGSV
ncbi:hypothetical protein A4G27_01810 [Mycobacterium kansasii]|nr:hypothetical protein A4G27_01810 [Mycobacterium kansasii]